MGRATRQCIATAGGAAPHWETRDEWQAALLQSYYESVVWHEFGHIMSLEHNFMGSVDKANWPTYKDANGNTQFGKYSSSIMEYSQIADDTFWNNGAKNAAPTTGWLPYDQGAIGWVYGNALSATNAGPKPAKPAAGQNVGASGQVSATAPWNDPLGWSGNTEYQFLFCSHEHIRYTPLCRQFDLGSTPSEITAADIESYEWNYNWRNFRQYYKVWDDSTYATKVTDIITDTRRFMAMQNWDWSAAELTAKLIAVGINPPNGAANAGLFYKELTDQFNSDVGASINLIDAFHEAIIQQSTGQRPFQTQYDPYYGDVVQQGISVDKEVAFVNFLGIWPYDNYDPTQAAGYWASSMIVGPGQTQPSQAWSTAGSMLGEKGLWDAYPEFFPSAVALFGHDTQTAVFTTLAYQGLTGGQPAAVSPAAMRDWIGGHTFIRQADALAFFQTLALQFPQSPVSIDAKCTDATNPGACSYNPMTPQTSANDIGHSNPLTQAFIGPDGRRWAWTYLVDRNQWFFADQDRNSSAYFQVVTYNQDALVNYDDGNTPGTVYGLQAHLKFMIDSYVQFGGDTGQANN
jgi:hypothetical protein